jgi:hypothetical protein
LFKKIKALVDRYDLTKLGNTAHSAHPDGETFSSKSYYIAFEVSSAAAPAAPRLRPSACARVEAQPDSHARPALTSFKERADTSEDLMASAYTTHLSGIMAMFHDGGTTADDSSTEANSGGIPPPRGRR